MKSFAIYLILFIFVFLTPSSGSANDQSADIIQSFATYKYAILNDNGELAYSLVDKNTREYFDMITYMAIYGDKQSVLALGFGDRADVLRMRHTIPHDLLINLNGKDYFKYSIDRKWFGNDMMYNVLSLGQIKIDGQFARVEALYQGQPSGYYLHFYYENDVWKQDIKYFLKYWENSLLPLVEMDDQSEEEFLFNTIGSGSGKPVDPSTIYVPLK